MATIPLPRRQQIHKLAARMRVKQAVTNLRIAARRKQANNPTSQPASPSASGTLDWLDKNAPLFATGAGGAGLLNQFINDVDDDGRKRPRSRYLPWLALALGGLGLGLHRKGQLPSAEELGAAGSSLADAGKSLGLGYTPYPSQ